MQSIHLAITKNVTQNAVIALPASKSIANRLLLINALSGNKINITNLSTAHDTQLAQNILSTLPIHPQQPFEIDCQDAGTVMRFLTAFFCITGGQWLLKGTPRMHQRPISILVNTLRQLGASIQYAEEEGYPPLLIEGKKLESAKLKVDASVSSQYISALMMVAPYIGNGIQIELTGKIASLPYIKMTAGLMQQCGAGVTINNNTIFIANTTYSANTIHVENDWSAASYWYAFVAVSSYKKIVLAGVEKNSLQGDSILAVWMEELGVKTTYTSEGVVLQAIPNTNIFFEKDFSHHPDLALAFVCLCAALGIEGLFYGLESLALKESNRTEALAIELKKIDVFFEQKNDAWKLTLNTALATMKQPVVFDTYNDHRIAMALSMFAFVLPSVTIMHPQVVKKSYPHFWEDFTNVFGVAPLSTMVF